MRAPQGRNIGSKERSSLGTLRVLPPHNKPEIPHMSSSPNITIVQPRPDGSLPVQAGASAQEPSTQELQARVEALQDKVNDFQTLLAKPLSEILDDREKALEAAAAWDAFGAMWMLSQRAMRRVALDLAALQGVSEAEVVAKGMALANEVLNGDGVDLNGSIAPAQMEHIARHRAQLRKQFRPG